MRLVSNHDPKDISGVELAMSSDPSIAKIILTAYPGYESARSALTPHPFGHAPAVAYVGKEEGFEALLDKLASAVVRLGINSRLHIEWETFDALSVARVVLPDADGEFLLDQAPAVEDLFRRLFPGFDRVRIVRALFGVDRRIALEVRAWHPEKGQGSFMVVCGRNHVVGEEAQRFREYSPGPSVSVPFLRSAVSTTHLGALAYEYSSARFERAPTFADVYKSGTETSVLAALHKLFGETLVAWHAGHPVMHQDAVRCTDHCSATDITVLFGEQVARVVGQLITVGVRVEVTPLGWRLGIRDRTLTFPRPEAVYTKVLGKLAKPLAQCVPGELRPETVLVVAHGPVLVTDFMHAGPAPWPRSFVAMECAVRFDLWNSGDPGELLEVERELGRINLLPLVVWHGPASHRKLAKTVSTIRQCAAERIRSDPFQYHIEVIRQIAIRIGWLAEQPARTDEDVDRLAHLVIAAAIWAQSLEKAGPSGHRRTGLEIDTGRRAALLDGALVELSRQNYALLLYLYQNAERVCGREELVTRVFDQAFDPADKSQDDRLNTAIRRLRERLEPDRGKPIYIVSSSDGYMLRPNSESF
jgi:hypothetical protein